MDDGTTTWSKEADESSTWSKEADESTSWDKEVDESTIWDKQGDETSTTTTAITDVSTLVIIQAADAVNFPTADFKIVIWGAAYDAPDEDEDKEIITISTRVASSWLVFDERAQDGTSQVDHAIGSNVALTAYAPSKWTKVT